MSSINERGDGQYQDLPERLAKLRDVRVATQSLHDGYNSNIYQQRNAYTTLAQSLSLQSALRRGRVKRMVLRKRRHVRAYQTHIAHPHLMLVMIICLTLLLIVSSSSIGAAFAYYKAQMPLLRGIAQHSLFQTTHIYDRKGRLLYDLYDHDRDDRGRRTYVNFNDIPKVLIDATIAAEDHSFWSNNGVDYYGIVRAAASDVKKNGVIEGGSTITQQLIKNQFFAGQPRTIQIKGEEAILATGLTQQYTKAQIMEMYLNTVFYGESNYGIEAATQDYFGYQPQCQQNHCVPAVKQLDLAQAALLAGLPQSPSSYKPTVYKERALERQAEVLNWMVNLKDITDQQRIDAQNEMRDYTFVSHSGEQKKLAPHFVNYVVDQLQQLLGTQNLYDGGYSVYTTLDLDLEQKVEQSVYDHLYKAQQDNYVGYYPALNTSHNVNDGAAVVIDPATGEILAMDGSADYTDNSKQVSGQVNVALSTDRQTGSAFKPIVYATAFEMGWYPAMILPDHRTYFPEPTDGKPYYAPDNYDRSFHTSFPMTIRQAVGNSFNIPAVDALNFVGPNVLNMANRLGLSEFAHLKAGDVTSSMALGTQPVSLLNMTRAYATFANHGVRMPTTSILSISDNQGHPIYTFDASQQHGVQALRPEIAFLVSSILSDKQARYHEFSPGNPLEMPWPAAAKTGTTEDYKDNWTLGYTPHLAVGVWAGNSDGELMHDVIGITGAGPIWHDIMEYATQHYNYAPDNFQQPNNVHMETVSAYTGLLPHAGEPSVSDWFINGTQPTIQGAFYSPPVQQNCSQMQPGQGQDAGQHAEMRCNNSSSSNQNAGNQNSDNQNSNNQNAGNQNFGNNQNDQGNTPQAIATASAMLNNTAAP